MISMRIWKMEPIAIWICGIDFPKNCQKKNRFLMTIQHLSWLGRQDSNLGMAESKSA
jgi:hypothetical protein